MSEYFNDVSKRVLSSALNISNSFGHGYVGCEHLLLALVKEDGEAKEGLLYRGELSYKRMAELISLTEPVALPIEATAKNITEKLGEALRNSHAYAKEHRFKEIGKEQLLAGMLAVDRSNVGVFLGMCGISVGELREETEKWLQDHAPEKPQERSPLHFPNLEKYGKNLTERAGQKDVDPFIGRESECAKVIQILTKKRKSNPCLLGEAGVGKTALAEGLAKRIVSGAVPPVLADCQIFSLDLSVLVAGTKYRGDFESRLKEIIQEASHPSVILFIDEIHMLVGCGGAEGAIDGANILKPALAKGDIRLIGATTVREYEKYIEKDGALDRRFTRVLLEEPDERETLRILKGLKPAYEKHHCVEIPDQLLNDVVYLASRHIKDRFMPDKAIDLLDESCAALQIQDGVNDRVLRRSDLIKTLSLENRRLTGLSEKMRVQLICRDKQILKIEELLLSDELSPLVFAGKKGTGRHECARTLARCLYGGEQFFLLADEVLASGKEKKGIQGVLFFENAERMTEREIETALALVKGDSHRKCTLIFCCNEREQTAIGYGCHTKKVQIPGISMDRTIYFEEYCDEDIERITRKIYNESIIDISFHADPDSCCGPIVHKVMAQKKKGTCNIRTIVNREIEQLFSGQM